MGQRITDKLVREITPPESGNRITYDDEISGFGIRVSAGGSKAFVLNYRVGSRERAFHPGVHHLPIF